MATRKWRGDAPAVAQVTSYTFGGTWEADDVITLTLNGKTLTVTAGSTTTNTVVDNVVTAWNASTIPEFEEITASRSGSALVLTADTAGKPFTNPTLATTEAGGGGADSQTIGSATATTASSGPNDWSVAANWTGAAVPVDADDVVIENSDVSILYGLDQSSIQPATLTIYQSFTGTIGLPALNIDAGIGEDAYYEYRETYLKIGPTTLAIGQGPGAGSGRIKINCGTDQVAAQIYNSGEPAEEGLEAILLKGTHASNALQVVKGSVGVAVMAGETATIATLRVGYTDNVAGDSRVRCGSGVTLTTINQSGGTLETNSNLTTINKTDGEWSHFAGTVGTANLDGGNAYYRSTGTLTTLNISEGSEVSFARDMRARTVTNCNLYQGGSILDPFATVTFTNGIVTPRCQLTDVTLNTGHNRTYTIA